MAPSFDKNDHTVADAVEVSIVFRNINAANFNERHYISIS
jgi:hypothetical protein